MQKLNEGSDLIHTTTQFIDSNNTIIQNEQTGLQIDQVLSKWEFIDNF